MFYTLEGIDGAGCGVVRRALEKKLTEEKIPYETLKYPVPALPFGRDIYDFLDSKIEMTSEVQFLAFIGQMVAEKKRIQKLRKKVLIVDRYLPCTLVFQGANGFPLAKGLAVAKLFELERPDRIFYLQLPWQVAFERKNKEARTSDRHETDKGLYKRTATLYDELLAKKVLGKWQVVDATQTPEEEAECIMKIIRKDIKNK
jgi:thymidylate kinase